MTYNDYEHIGTCSICGGKVMAFTGLWNGIFPPTPHCAGCGAWRDDRPPLPIIPMRPALPQQNTPSTGTLPQYTLRTFSKL